MKSDNSILLILGVDYHLILVHCVYQLGVRFGARVTKPLRNDDWGHLQK